MHRINALPSLLLVLAGLTACAGNMPPPAAPIRVASTVDRALSEPCIERGVPAIQAQAQYLGLLRPASQEYRLERVDRPQDRLLCKFLQVNGGVPVQHHEYNVHLSPSGQVLLSSGRYSRDAAQQSSVPRISPLEVMEKAYEDTAATLQTNTPALTPPQLQFQAATATQFLLVYHLVASHPQTGAVRLTYDANSGQRLLLQRLSSGAAPAAP